MSTKIHATCDALGNPTGFHLTPGQCHDLDGFDVLVEELDDNVEAMLGGKAYDAEERGHQRLKAKGCIAVIPPRRNRRSPRRYDKHLYTARHLIENVFAKLKQDRALATRYDKTDRNFLGAIYLAASVLWLN